MLRLLLALLLCTANASAAPPDAPRIEGFHRVWVSPDPFADDLVPTEASAPKVSDDPPRAVVPGVVVVSLDADAVEAAGLTPRTLADHLRELEGMVDVRLSEAEDAVWVQLATPRDPSDLKVPHFQGPPVTLGDLGKVHPMPRLGPRMPVPDKPALPSDPTGHDLVVVNELDIRAEVRIGEVTVGTLDPRAEGVVHGVRPGTYAVTLVGPDGAEHDLTVETRPPRKPVDKPPRPKRIR